MLRSELSMIKANIILLNRTRVSTYIPPHQTHNQSRLSTSSGAPSGTRLVNWGKNFWLRGPPTTIRKMATAICLGE